MGDETLRISDGETAAPVQDRFQRFRLISWWDQARLSAARVLVVGAGALGNEIVKNLALLGIGQVLIADMDRIENSNLSRSVLFRASDNGRMKADVAAEAAKQIYPGMHAAAFNGNVVYDLGLGVYRWADVVLGGLDNREARLAINRACWKIGRPWIDGAIEAIAGTARVFAPRRDSDDAPCYECTMTQTDWTLLQNRRSCNLLSRSDMQAGKTPTTPTIASIIAGVQCQEAVKLLHGMPSLAGKGWVFAGESADSYIVEYQRKADCMSHEALDEIVALNGGVAQLTARQLLDEARRRLGGDAQLELARDVLEALICPACGKREDMFLSMGKVKAEQARCPACGEARRQVKTFYRLDGNEPFLDRTLAELGVPPFDIIVARGAERAIGLELSADASAVLGRDMPVAVEEKPSAEGLQWT